MTKEHIKLVLSRRVGMRDIKALLTVPISRISSRPWGRANEGCRGFALLELLVVVLIIGVLASIALPQYQKAVLKSRFSSLMPLAKIVSDSEEAYYLEHGHYTDIPTQLDVTTTDTRANITLGSEENHQYVKLTRGDIKNNLTVYQKHSPNFAGEVHCEAEIDNTLANWLCADSLKGTYIGNKYGYSIYALNTEDPTGTLARLFYDKQEALLTDGDVCISTLGGNGGCYKVKATNSACTTKVYYGCQGGTFDNSTCEGKANRACASGAFTNHSQCYGSGWPYSCSYGSTFDNSICFGLSDSCGSGSYTNHSMCVGTAFGCHNGTFTDHSICYAIGHRESHSVSGCDGSTYDATSCCTGDYCQHEEDTCAYKGITAPPQPVYQAPSVN